MASSSSSGGEIGLSSLSTAKKGQQDDAQSDNSMKIVMVGNAACGKTQLALRYCTDQFNQQHLPTVGTFSRNRTVNFEDGTTFRLEIWDSGAPGNYIEGYQMVTDGLYRDAKGALLVYDVTDLESFNIIPDWLNEIRSQQTKNKSVFVIMLVGNKIDLVGRRVVTTKQGQELSKKERVLFMETSALEDRYVRAAFRNLVTEILRRTEKAAKNQSGSDSETEMIAKKQKGKCTPSCVIL